MCENGPCRKREWAEVDGSLAIAGLSVPLRARSEPMILNAYLHKLKREARDDFRTRRFEAALIVQAVSWYFAMRRVIVT